MRAESDHSRVLALILRGLPRELPATYEERELWGRRLARVLVDRDANSGDEFKIEFMRALGMTPMARADEGRLERAARWRLRVNAVELRPEEIASPAPGLGEGKKVERGIYERSGGTFRVKFTRGGVPFSRSAGSLEEARNARNRAEALASADEGALAGALAEATRQRDRAREAERRRRERIAAPATGWAMVRERSWLACGDVDGRETAEPLPVDRFVARAGRIFVKTGEIPLVGRGTMLPTVVRLIKSEAKRMDATIRLRSHVWDEGSIWASFDPDRADEAIIWITSDVPDNGPTSQRRRDYHALRRKRTAASLVRM